MMILMSIESPSLTLSRIGYVGFSDFELVGMGRIVAATERQMSATRNMENTLPSLRQLLLKVFLVAVFLFPSSLLATDGIFRGRVVDPPVLEPQNRDWIFVQGRNQLVRRVEVAHATVVLPSAARAQRKRPCNFECIMPGQEVRVTARQDLAGEWRAKKVEIIKLAQSDLPFASISVVPLCARAIATGSSLLDRDVLDALKTKRPTQFDRNQVALRDQTQIWPREQALPTSVPNDKKIIARFYRPAQAGIGPQVL